ncbi:MAG: RidA family protein [Rhodospirillaceae bacterium]|nr:RidA family protein [Rhodospirillaceae bacterium]
MDIERIGGGSKGRSAGTAYGGLVWAVAVDPKSSDSMVDQTRGALARIDEILAKAGTNKSRILNATVYVSVMEKKGEMDVAWTEWAGDDPQGWAQRACVGTKLAPGHLVEIVVIAARDA